MRVWRREGGVRREEQGGRREGEQRTVVEGVPEARRQGFGFEEDCCSRGLQICANPITARLRQSPSLSLSLSLGAQTFDTNKSPEMSTGVETLEGISTASEMNTIVETFDNFWTKCTKT